MQLLLLFLLLLLLHLRRCFLLAGTISLTVPYSLCPLSLFLSLFLFASFWAALHIYLLHTCWQFLLLLLLLNFYSFKRAVDKLLSQLQQQQEGEQQQQQQRHQQQQK